MASRGLCPASRQARPPSPSEELAHLQQKADTSPTRPDGSVQNQLQFCIKAKICTWPFSFKFPAL